MNLSPDDAATEDPRLFQAVQDYLAEVEAGRRPDRRAFAARFPDLSDAMAPYLEALDAVHAATPQLQQSSAGRPAPASADLNLAEPLGDFRIVREIARGGMGTVYEAMQLSLGRKVALKVLPFAAALDSKQLQRFKNEAHAAAQLHHTNIVPVYAVGMERGVHYYAMQLIEGQNLAVVIESLRHGVKDVESGNQSDRQPEPQPVKQEDTTDFFSPSPSPSFSRAPAPTRTIQGTHLTTQRTVRTRDFFRTVARMTVQVAEGLEYAHGLGIIHRDIKPANLLVDAHGTVWITDFGLATFHTDVGLTQTGDLLGTLRYMSPEQASGQRVLLDHRTDIYSLGASLYELLTLVPIFDGQDRQLLLRQIMNEEPRPPRAIDRSIPEELETIVLKAISKTPSERYATAREFADDLQRFLRDEPILARRPTLLQRARKWLRRHPSVPIAATILLILLTLGSMVSAGFIRVEQKKADLAYEREKQRAEEAEQEFRLARQAVDDMIQLAEVELADKPYMEDLRRQLLEKALVYYQRFIEQRRDDPDAQDDLALTRKKVKNILGDLALMQGAGQLNLLREKAVLDDLRPSIEQSQRLEELEKRMEARHKSTFSDLHRISEKELGQRLLDLARANESDVATILTRQQRDRVKQIYLQVKGADAFREPWVIRELKIAGDQKARIEGILMAEAIAGMRGFGRDRLTRVGPGGPGGPFQSPPGERDPGRPGPFDAGRGGPIDEEKRKAFEEERLKAIQEWQKAIEERRKKATEKILAELSKDQRKQWQEMIGEEFKGQLKGPMGGFFGKPPHLQGPRRGPDPK
jgi:serine/threonine protein kinase